jgi:hypothetical protein
MTKKWIPVHCRWNVIATQPIGLVSFQAPGILPVAEEQSRTRVSQSNGVEDQPQCLGMWHSSRRSARSLSRSPSPPPPFFTQSPSPPRSLVRDGQTSPHRPRLVASRSTCPPLSPFPLSNSFIIGTAVINTVTRQKSQRSVEREDLHPGTRSGEMMGQEKRRKGRRSSTAGKGQAGGSWERRYSGAETGR